MAAARGGRQWRPGPGPAAEMRKAVAAARPVLALRPLKVGGGADRGRYFCVMLMTLTPDDASVYLWFTNLENRLWGPTPRRTERWLGRAFGCFVRNSAFSLAVLPLAFRRGRHGMGCCCNAGRVSGLGRRWVNTLRHFDQWTEPFIGTLNIIHIIIIVKMVSITA